MKQVITNTWCDAHLARDVSEEVHGITIPVAIDGEGPLGLDLCAECISIYVDPLRKLMATFGQPFELPADPAPKRKRTSPRVAAPAAPEAAPEKPKRSRRKAAAKAPTAADIRAWAVEQGFQVPDRGRIPQDVRAAYEANHSGKSRTRAKA